MTAEARRTQHDWADSMVRSWDPYWKCRRCGKKSKYRMRAVTCAGPRSARLILALPPPESATGMACLTAPHPLGVARLVNAVFGFRYYFFQ